MMQGTVRSAATIAGIGTRRVLFLIEQFSEELVYDTGF